MVEKSGKEETRTSRNSLLFHAALPNATRPLDKRNGAAGSSFLTARSCPRTEGLVLGALFRHGRESRGCSGRRQYRGHEQGLVELGQAARNDLACQPTSRVFSLDWNPPLRSHKSGRRQIQLRRMGCRPRGSSPQVVARAFAVLVLARGAP